MLDFDVEVQTALGAVEFAALGVGTDEFTLDFGRRPPHVLLPLVRLVYLAVRPHMQMGLRVRVRFLVIRRRVLFGLLIIVVVVGTIRGFFGPGGHGARVRILIVVVVRLIVGILVSIR